MSLTVLSSIKDGCPERVLTEIFQTIFRMFYQKLYLHQKSCATCFYNISSVLKFIQNTMNFITSRDQYTIASQLIGK